MTRPELQLFYGQLQHCERCRYWTWAEPERHHSCLKGWPPGYLAALRRWDVLPWRVCQLLAVDDFKALQPALYIWRQDLGFDLVLLSRQTYDETEFRQLASVAVASMAFLRGLLWRADPEIAIVQEWTMLEKLLARRRASLSEGQRLAADA